MNDLIRALESDDLQLLQSVPKADLHNHSLLGCRRSHMERFSGRTIPPFEYKGNGIHDVNHWISSFYSPLFREHGAIRAALEGAFLNAREDGIVMLEMSIDARFGRKFGLTPKEIISIMNEAHQKIAPQITFRPCMGLARNVPVSELIRDFESYLEFGYFQSIDLHDDELSQPPENFKELFRIARLHGLKCRAHAGEFGDAESVRKTVEILELDALLHGFSAATSPEIMKWLADRKIPLHICPTSNATLRLVPSIKAHPVRVLFDHGVIVTINTDDLILFDQSVSQEYLLLVREGVFSPAEMEQIRQNGLAS